MEEPPVCPRCGAPVREPGEWSGYWSCGLHGAVEPLRLFGPPSVETAQELAGALPLPIWLPWPLPAGWLVSGMGYAGEQPGRARASVLACSGPSPVGGLGELLIIAEEPSVGLGSAYAGLSAVDPGASFEGTAAQAKIQIGQHPTSLWCLTGPSDRAVYVGEAAGRWLWIVLHPASTGYLLAERLDLTDLRDLGGEIEMLPLGALTPKLTLASTSPPPPAR